MRVFSESAREIREQRFESRPERRCRRDKIDKTELGLEIGGPPDTEPAEKKCDRRCPHRGILGDARGASDDSTENTLLASYESLWLKRFPSDPTSIEDFPDRWNEGQHQEERRENSNGCQDPELSESRNGVE